MCFFLKYIFPKLYPLTTIEYNYKYNWEENIAGKQIKVASQISSCRLFAMFAGNIAGL